MLPHAPAAACTGATSTDICERAIFSPADTDADDAKRQALGASSKISLELQAIAANIRVRMAAGEALADYSDLTTESVRVSTAGTVQVYVLFHDLTPGGVHQLTSLGMDVELTLPEFGLVQGWLRSDMFDAAASIDGVVRITPPGYPAPKGSGAVSTDGDMVLNAALARTTFGVSGDGVKVGVLSNGVTNRATSVETGDLPPGIQVLKAGSGNEGTAILEIIHDLAPGAALAFYAPSTSADMVAGINALKGVGARIMVDDILWLDQPKFEDGMVAKAARAAATGGLVYVTAAGNDALRHYRSNYNRLPAQDPSSSSYEANHNFSPTEEDAGNTFVLNPGCRVQVNLQWSNKFGTAGDDFDLFLGRSSDMAVLARSIGLQNGNDNPVEALAYTNTSSAALTVFVAISEWAMVSDPSSIVFDFFVFGITCTTPALQYSTPEASVWGQAAVAEVLSVAAAPSSDPGVIQSYSSRGPGLISFPAPESRNVPNVTAVDCVQTRIGQVGLFPNPFCGTSAAAPHVAGIAALVLHRNGSLSSEELRGILLGGTVDLGPAGYDGASGFGRVDAMASLQATPPSQITLLAAILPSSRARPVGSPATVFATVIASGSGIATGCSIAPLTVIPAGFLYQTTNPATNALSGTANTPVSIAAGALQTFLVAITPTASFGSTDVALSFDCANSGPALVVSGLNTVLLTATSGPTPDIVALGATPSGDGIVNIPGVSGTGVFSVATSNVGASSSIIASVDTGGVALPVSVTMCQTTPATGQCTTAQASSITTTINAGQTPTFAVFVKGLGPVPFRPGVNRVFVRFKTFAGRTVGSTSVALRTL